MNARDSDGGAGADERRAGRRELCELACRAGNGPGQVRACGRSCRVCVEAGWAWSGAPQLLVARAGSQLWPGSHEWQAGLTGVRRGSYQLLLERLVAFSYEAASQD